LPAPIPNGGDFRPCSVRYTLSLSKRIWGYVREDKKKLYATDKGLFLLKQLQKGEKLYRIADVGETTAWEIQLQENPREFKKSIIEYLRSCIKQGDRERYVKEAPAFAPSAGGPWRKERKITTARGTNRTRPARSQCGKKLPAFRFPLPT
jgi:hypothetical protein